MLALCLRYTKKSPTCWRICLLEIITFSGDLSHLSSMKFLRKDPTSQVAPKQWGYFWSKLRFPSKYFSPQFWPMDTACLWGGGQQPPSLSCVWWWAGGGTFCPKCGWRHLQEGALGGQDMEPGQDTELRRLCAKVTTSKQASRWTCLGQIFMGCRSVHRPQAYNLQGHGCVLPRGLPRKS